MPNCEMRCPSSGQPKDRLLTCGGQKLAYLTGLRLETCPISIHRQGKDWRWDFRFPSADLARMALVLSMRASQALGVLSKTDWWTRHQRPILFEAMKSPMTSWHETRRIKTQSARQKETRYTHEPRACMPARRPCPHADKHVRWSQLEHGRTSKSSMSQRHHGGRA